ncbi:putative fasciclin-like arabinogalactan protein 20-like [Capsicum annuum]|nr:putative fasciclin-like arabinogalactan protein 20-like [Capsicum annuum]KAF3646689.1 putative fasciclin-like arabinogalactan protein 20-like [Capsicum annuum]
MSDAKPIDTPIGTRFKLDTNELGPKVNEIMYKGIIEALLYLIASRPDIFSVGICARFHAYPKESHLKVAKRIQRLCKLLWIKQQLEEFGIVSNTSPLLCDNTSALNMAKSPVQHKRTKHIDKKYDVNLHSTTTRCYRPASLETKQVRNCTATQYGAYSTVISSATLGNWGELLERMNVIPGFITTRPNCGTNTHKSYKKQKKSAKFYSKKNDFSTKTVADSLNSASVDVNPLLVNEVIKKLSNSGFWLYHSSIGPRRVGFVYNAESYHGLIEALGKIKQFKMVWILIDELKKKGLLSKDAFVLVSRRYARGRKVKEAIEAYERMEKYGLIHEDQEYNRLLHTLCKSRNVGKAQEVFDKWKGGNLRLMALSLILCYGIMIHSYCKVKKYYEAIEMLGEMEKKIKISGFELELFMYNAMVGAYCWSMCMDDAYRARRTNEAYSVFQKMSNDPGCEPTVSTYEIMVRMFCNEDRIYMALRVWDQMKAKGVLPGMISFSTLINSFYRENRLDDAYRYFQGMLDMGMKPPLPMFDNLRCALLDEGKEDTVKALWRKLEKLRKNPLVG